MEPKCSAFFFGTSVTWELLNNYWLKKKWEENYSPHNNECFQTGIFFCSVILSCWSHDGLWQGHMKTAAAVKGWMEKCWPEPATWWGEHSSLKLWCLNFHVRGDWEGGWENVADVRGTAVLPCVSTGAYETVPFSSYLLVCSFRDHVSAVGLFPTQWEGHSGTKSVSVARINWHWTLRY